MTRIASITFSLFESQGVKTIANQLLQSGWQIDRDNEGMTQHLPVEAEWGDYYITSMTDADILDEAVERVAVGKCGILYILFSYEDRLTGGYLMLPPNGLSFTLVVVSNPKSILGSQWTDVSYYVAKVLGSFKATGQIQSIESDQS